MFEKQYVAGMDQVLDPGVPGCIPTRAIVGVPEQAMQGRLLGWVPAAYPSQALTKRIQGTVVLQIYVDEYGNVYTAKPADGPAALVPAAIEAVKNWKYRPFLFGNTPVAMATTVHVPFVLPAQ